MPDIDYTTWDRQYLDLQYAPSKHLLGGLEPFMREYRTRSREAREALTGYRELRFGPHPDERLSLFLPRRQEASALQIFFHGGSWQLSSKDEFDFPAQAFVAQGFAYASVNYSLRSTATIGHMVAQCRRALAWLYAHAGDYGLDRLRFFVSGHSAGAQLAAMCLAPGWQEARRLPTDAIKGACLVSGIFDLEPLRHGSENEILGLTRAEALANSPIHRLPEPGCPLIGCYGQNETSEFIRQTRDYITACRRKGLSCWLLPLEGCHHFDVILEFANTKSRLFRAVARQMQT